MVRLQGAVWSSQLWEVVGAVWVFTPIQRAIKPQGPHAGQSVDWRICFCIVILTGSSSMRNSEPLKNSWSLPVASICSTRKSEAFQFKHPSVLHDFAPFCLCDAQNPIIAVVSKYKHRTAVWTVLVNLNVLISHGYCLHMRSYMGLNKDTQTFKLSVVVTFAHHLRALDWFMEGQGLKI